mgnify:CR=1 FL=1
MLKGTRIIFKATDFGSSPFLVLFFPEYGLLLYLGDSLWLICLRIKPWNGRIKAWNDRIMAWYDCFMTLIRAIYHYLDINITFCVCLYHIVFVSYETYKIQSNKFNYKSLSYFSVRSFFFSYSFAFRSLFNSSPFALLYAFVMLSLCLRYASVMLPLCHRFVNVGRSSSQRR